MKTKFMYSSLLATILIFCSCVADDETELLVNKNSQYSIETQKVQYETFILPEYNLFQISDFDNDKTSEFSNLIIGEGF